MYEIFMMCSQQYHSLRLDAGATSHNCYIHVVYPHSAYSAGNAERWCGQLKPSYYRG